LLRFISISLGLVRRGSYFHLTRNNEIRFFDPVLESFPGNVFPGHHFSKWFVKTVFGQGIAPGKLAIEHSLFLYALAKTQISIREILSKVGVRTYHYHQLHLLAQRLVSVVPVPLRLVYNLLPGLYAPRHFPRRLGFFDSSQSLVFGIKEYIADLPHLLVYNGMFESREDFWFALGVILIHNYLADAFHADDVTDQEEISNVGPNGASATVNNDDVDSAVDWNKLPLTEITKDHYLADSEFGDMYQYLSASVLTGDDKKDRMILLLSDQFYLRDDLLWKLSLPRNKTEQRLRPMSERLCVPKIFRHEILDYFHQHLGHLGTQRLFFYISLSCVLEGIVRGY